MASMLDLVVESDRLRLIAVAEEHADNIRREFTAEITEFMRPGPTATRSEALAFIRQSRAKMERGEEFVAAVLLTPGHDFHGICGIHHVDTDTPELGIWIKKGAHGQGYGREAVTALARWSFATLPRLRYLIYPVDRRNVPSRKIPESLGGVIEDEYVQESQDGRTLDLVEYRIYPP